MMFIDFEKNKQTLTFSLRNMSFNNACRQGRAIDVIRHNLLGEISTRPMDVQGILASEIHHALETFRQVCLLALYAS